MLIEYSRRPFTVDEYDQMVATGIFRDGDRVELIEGEIVAMNPIGSPHAACVSKLDHVLARLLGDRSQIRVQCPVAIPDWSEPNPDVALVARRAGFYVTGHPLPRDVQVLIEAADSSFTYDTQKKAPLYAKGGIREYWVIDLNSNRVLVYTRLRDGQYSNIRTHNRGDRFTSQRFPGVEFKVRDLLP